MGWFFLFLFPFFFFFFFHLGIQRNTCKYRPPRGPTRYLVKSPRTYGIDSTDFVKRKITMGEYTATIRTTTGVVTHVRTSCCGSGQVRATQDKETPVVTVVRAIYRQSVTIAHSGFTRDLQIQYTSTTMTLTTQNEMRASTMDKWVSPMGSAMEVNQWIRKRRKRKSKERTEKKPSFGYFQEVRFFTVSSIFA